MFDGHLDPEDLRGWMEQLTARPHHVGSPYGKQNAHWLQKQFASWGFDAQIEVFHVLFPTPKVRIVERVLPTPFAATLVEPPVAGDRTSEMAGALPGYNAYSIDGDVTAPLVYVNYGTPADYEILEQRGIDVAGKIVIARYGGSWRGIKPKVAAEKGAVGCILYSDPRDDGYWRGTVYPEGSFKNASGVQRGSVADMPLFPGDPLTPGVGATKDAERLERHEAPTLTKIPVLPISHGDALPLLETLAGPVAPDDWRGALPITYRLGPGPTTVHLKLEFDWNIVPAYNVIAKLAGSTLPDEWILRGNHHDAWVFGADDPISGIVAMMAEAQAIGRLAADGWRPERTIVYAAWDAEEPGLLGSTEWVEHHAAALRDRAAVYINTDSNGRGFLRAGGSHTLERFLSQVAADVADPQTAVSVAERARAREMVFGGPEAIRETREQPGLRLAALGSGSDYTPFLQHLGIASLNLGFGGENAGGEYHSIYDSFDHYTRFGDPGFAYGVTLASTTGRAVLRLANARVLPFEFQALAGTVAGYVREIEEFTDKLRQQVDLHNALLEEGRFAAAYDPTLELKLPEPREPVPHFNLAPLNNAVTRLHRSAERYDSGYAGVMQTEIALSTEERRSLDRLLFLGERALTHGDGLPGRPWFRHLVYAPGFYTGYGVKTLPGVREAIEQQQYSTVAGEVERLAGVLGAFADGIDEAVKIWESKSEPEAH